MSSEKFHNYTSHEFHNISFTWTIDNYSLLRKYNLHTNLHSKEFSDWQFKLKIPDGYDDEFVVCLQKHVLCGSLKGLCKIYLQDGSIACQEEFYTARNTLYLSLTSWNEIFDVNSGLLIDDKLIINCEIGLLKARVENPIYIPNISTSKLSEDLAAIFESKELADVTIVTVDDQKIPTHKFILSARSKVFAAMFRHPMKENQENCVVIEDFTADVVTELLRFIYTGESPNFQIFSLKFTTDLMGAAHMYDLDELKTLCAQSMSENLSINTAPIVLKTAKLYNIEDLTSEAFNFIQNNFQKVSETSNWRDLLTTDRMFILETFINPKFIALKVSDNDDDSNN